MQRFVNLISMVANSTLLHNNTGAITTMEESSGEIVMVHKFSFLVIGLVFI
jgi:hypothetical protein